MADMISAIRPEAYTNVQLDAGIFIVGFDYSALTTADAVISAVQALVAGNDTSLLGATEGGGTFRCVPTVREITMDGYRSPIKGAKVIDGWDVRLTTTMKEFKSSGIQAALPTATKTTTGKVTTWTVAQALANDDYTDSIVWLGNLGSSGVTLIELKNVLNTSGLNFTFKDKGEGTFNLELVAHIASASDIKDCPCKIVTFE